MKYKVEGPMQNVSLVREDNGYGEWIAVPGGTGDCWNILDSSEVDDEDRCFFHICELDEFIAALTALRDSKQHAENVARWA